MEEIQDLRSQFQSGSEKNQLQLIPKLMDIGEEGWEILMEFLLNSQSSPVNLTMGKAYQTLCQVNTAKTEEFLQTNFPYGVVSLQSQKNIDYLPLQRSLSKLDFEGSDVLTLALLCELAGSAAIARKWLYFTEVDNFPSMDLETIDRLWWFYSEGKFGFSVQRKIWLSLGKDFTKLWSKIGWKSGKNWTRYPNEFIWNLSAPQGHLPTSNQLRGSQVIQSLFCHPVWEKREL